MESIKEWALLVAACAILAEICSMLMPEGQSRKTGMLVLGLVMVFALILPMGDFYSLLQKADFSYETERTQITEKLERYTEEQMMQVTKEYKQRLTDYMCQLVNDVDGVGEAQVDFVMEEDYEKETYGIVKRIYVTAYGSSKTVEATQTPNSGFSQMAPIERIEITLEGITVIPTEDETEDKPEQTTDPRVAAVKAVLQEAFRLEENCIFAEVKDD